MKYNRKSFIHTKVNQQRSQHIKSNFEMIKEASTSTKKTINNSQQKLQAEMAKQMLLLPYKNLVTAVPRS